MTKQVKFSRMLKIIRNLSRLENPRLNKLLRKCVISKVITTNQRSSGKVMVSCVSVSLSVHGGLMWPLLMMHWMSLYRDPQLLPWPSSRHGTPPQHLPYPPSIHGTPLLPVPSPLLVTSGGHHWTPVQTCSFEDPRHCC